jgi:tetratricopeptide (TPR) repeat protein
LGKQKPSTLGAATLAKFLERATDLHGRGRFEEAISLYEHVETKNPEELSAPYFLAIIDLETGKLGRALDRLRSLTRKAPDSFEAVFALAFTFGELGEWQLAADGYRRALVLKPQSTAARFALAHALEVTGQLDDAVKHYRALAQLPLVRLRALIGVIRIKPSAISPAQREEITVAARDETTPPGLRIGLLFALGESLEASGRYDDAFRTFVQGNSLRRRHITESLDEAPEIVIQPPSSKARADHPEKAAARHAEMIGSHKTVFTPEFLNSHSGKGHASSAPIFIVGMPRSGSTLIEQILSSHRNVDGLGEVPAVWRTIQGKFPLQYAHADPQPDHFHVLAENYLALQRGYGWRKSPFFVDKMLGNYLALGMIHLMFPNATILHAVRDPTDTCVSCFRQLFRTGNETTYDLSDIGAQYVRYREMMAHWEAVLPPGRIKSVRHEDLIANPEVKIRWLLEACGLKWDENCLRFHQTKRPVRTASVAQVREPIFTRSLDRWRKYADHLGPLFEAMGPFAPKQ